MNTSKNISLKKWKVFRVGKCMTPILECSEWSKSGIKGAKYQLGAECRKSLDKEAQTKGKGEETRPQ